ncbi:MAG TPA: type II/IV secretion system ATPase subunit, partial [Candidatus Micrarchaeota archaeon]|nr:type II/IV secretion system ATPase subunit [Candidatus Micrarchaeota archaeon]
KAAVLDAYSIEADFVPANIKIAQLNESSYYMVEFEGLTYPTRAFLDQIRDELSNKMPAMSVEYSDLEKTTAMKNLFFKNTMAYLKNFQFDDKSTNLFAGLLLHRMFGLGEIDVLTHDDSLEEIAINNATTPISVYHRKFGWLRTNLYLPNEEEILNFASQIGRKVGRQIAVLNPIMDARLESGDRVCATLSPISSHGNTITIRRFARNPWTIISLLSDRSNTMTSEMAALLWIAFHYELNVIVAGGTASGKTSALNALCAFFPPNQRIITIEDTREIMLPEHQWNWIPLITRNPNAEGLGEVSMLDLLVTSLRMRPDRIILGEMRRAPEAEVLFEAMHTGHSTYSTMHADTSAQVLRRLTQPPIAIPPA